MNSNERLIVECDHCHAPVPFDGTAFYWTPQGYQVRPTYCATCAVQHNAPLIKPQPKRTAANTATASNGQIWDI